MNQGIARLTGIIYLILIAAGIYATVFIRSSLIVSGDAVTTAQNIMASEGLFRVSIASDLIMIIADVALAVLFYVLLRPVSRTLALVATFFRLIQAAILGINLLNLSISLEFLTANNSGFEGAQLNSLANVFLNAQDIGYDLGLVFFAISLAALSYLLYTSRYVPRFLSVLLAGSALVYLAGSFVTVLAPRLSRMLELAYILPFIAELGIALWLIIRGVNTRGQNNQPSFNNSRNEYA